MYAYQCTSTNPHNPSSVERFSDVLDAPLETKIHLLCHHMKLAKLLVEEMIEEEVIDMAGPRYSRGNKPHNGRYSRYGTNPGSVRLGDEKVPIRVQRMRDNDTDEPFSPESYQQMQALPALDEQLQESILLGLAQADYGRLASTLADSFGLSQSTISRRFVDRSAEALKEFQERSLADDAFVALWIDGKHLAGEQMVICMGMTDAGEKKVLGFVQATTEHSEPIKSLFRDLIDRGLTFDAGLLCIIDGGKGLYKAVCEIFGQKAQVQRCQWHKRENVVGYLRKADQKTFRGKLQRAYQEPTYKAAHAALKEIHAELQQLNTSAARSLQEGLEETLTLHRLGLFEELGRSLKTTNCIESLNSRVGRYQQKVKRWHHSEQRHRWMALSLMEAESRMKRIAGYEYLDNLRNALKKTIKH